MKLNVKSFIWGLLFLMIFYKSRGQDLVSSGPFVLGEVVEMKSFLLQENRTLNIYMPSSYKKEDTGRYPVIYLLDGSADEDFIHIAGLIQFYTFEWIATLKPCILVGIANTNRRRDFTFPSRFEEERSRHTGTGGSGRFKDALEKEMIPFIEKRYRCNKERSLVGQSLGGLLAVEILLERPSLFSNYIIVSPSLWWDDGSLLEKNIPRFSRATSIYLACGKEGLAPSVKPHVMEVDANILAERLQKATDANLRFYFDYLPDKDHSDILHQAVSNAIGWMFKK